MEADGADTWERLTIEVKNYDGKAWVRRKPILSSNVL